MNYAFCPMSQQQAEEISEWQYEGDYAFYNIAADLDDLKEFLSPVDRADSYFSVIGKNGLIGFYCFNEISPGILDIGLGMKPDFTGKGLGLAFLKAGLDFASAHYHPEKITLAVAAFNERAINVYKKAGFQQEETFLQKTNGSHHKFVRMKLALKQRQT